MVDYCWMWWVSPAGACDRLRLRPDGPDAATARFWHQEPDTLPGWCYLPTAEVFAPTDELAARRLALERRSAAAAGLRRELERAEALVAEAEAAMALLEPQAALPLALAPVGGVQSG